MSDTKPQIEKTQRTPSRINAKKKNKNKNKTQTLGISFSDKRTSKIKNPKSRGEAETPYLKRSKTQN